MAAWSRVRWGESECGANEEEVEEEEEEGRREGVTH